MRRVALAVLTTLTVLATGCSSEGSADLDLGTAAPTPSSTTVGTSTTSATSTVPATQAPAVTDAPTTVAATVATDPPTTEPPTTAPASKDDQVRADFEAARLARTDCTYDPLTCDFAAVAVPGSPMDLQTREVVAKRIEDNLRGKPGYGGVQLTVESVGFEGDRAFVTVCVYDTGVLFDIQDPADPGDDIVVDDSTSSYRVRWTMERPDTRWLLVVGEQLERLSEANLCAS